MTASRFGRRPRRDVRRPAALVGVAGPKLFVESLEDRTTPSYNPNPLFVPGTLPPATSPFGGSNSNGAPTAMIVGDFNGDGKPDFAALPNTNAAGTGIPNIDVYLSNPNGAGFTYTSINTFNESFSPASLAAVDVDGDGKDEIATVSQSTGDVLLYYLNGGTTSTTFSSAFFYQTQIDFDASSPAKPNMSLGGVTAGDFNRDGKEDLLVTLTASNNAANNQYYVLLSKGGSPGSFTNAGFTAIPTPLRIPGSTNFTKPLTADFNGDGNPDVAMLNTTTDQAVVLFGDGTGGFSFARTLALNDPQGRSLGNPVALAVGDFDHSGTLDLAVGTNPTAASGSGTVSLFLKDPTGNTFQQAGLQSKANPIALTGGLRIAGLAAGDFNVDTYDDLAVVSATATGTVTQDVDVYLSSKDVANTPLTLAAGSPYSSQGTSTPGGSVIALDVDRNGNTDFVVGQGTTGGQQYVPYINQSGVGGDTFLTESAATTEFGQPVTYGVVVYPPPLGGPLPTGTVTFSEVTTDTAGNQTLTALGTGTLTPSLDAQGTSISVTTFRKADFPVGQHVVVAQYSGDLTYAARTSASQTVTVTKAVTTAKVTTTVPDPVFGQPVPLTATVTTRAGQFPGGNVAFFDNGNQIGSGVLDANGQVTITVDDFALGNHSVVADYLGNLPNYPATVSVGLQLTVAKANSTTALTVSRPAIAFGDPVTLTAAVGIAAPGVGTPTGSVDFYDGTTKVGSAAVTASAGAATLTLPGLAVGPHAFTAAYTGSTSVAASQSAAATVTVASVGSVAGLVADPTTSQVGAPVTLTAFVTDTMSPPRPLGVGTVTFVGTDAAGKAISLGPVAVANGQAVTTYSALPLGTATFKAVFSGTDSVPGATSPPVVVTTQRSTPVVTSTNSLNSSTAIVGQDVTFDTQFSPGTGLSVPVTGTATFADNGTVLGTVPLVDGLASYTARLARGSHTITTTYSGDATYAPTTASVPFLVNNPVDSITVGAGSGGTDIVRIYNPDGSVTKNPLFAFGPDNTSGARVASGDLNGDGVQDYVIGTGPGTQARIRGFDGVTNAPLFDIFPFENFTGGVFVSVGDINGDLRGDIVVTPDQGGGPRVSIFDGSTYNRIADFFGIDDPNFRGGARAAVGDVNGDGVNDVVVSAGFGGGPRIAAYDGRALRQNAEVKLFNDFFAFDPSLRNGAFVAVGDVDGDGKGDLVLGAGPGGGPRVIAVSGNDLVRSGGTLITLKANFFAGDVDSRGGVPVAVRNLDSDAKADIVTGSGPGSRRVSVYLGASLTPNGQPTPSQSFDAFDDNFNPQGGVFVG